jgi:GntR family transcriptional regulator
MPRHLGDDTKPLWQRVHEDLLTRLTAGEFPDRFPTDYELVDEYGVSRHTVREAIRRLEADGLLTRHRGRGTFVNKEAINQPLSSTIYSLFNSLEEQGFQQDSDVLTSELRRERAAAEQLGVAADAELFFLERLRRVDGTPLALDRTWLPADPYGDLVEADFTRTALYGELARRHGVTPVSGTEHLRPIVPTGTEREILGLDEGEAVFLIERRTESANGPLEWRESLVRGDIYRFEVTWQRAGDPPSFELG